jgi:hypothetical protein
MALLRQGPAAKALLDKAAPFQKTTIGRCHRIAVGDIAQGDDFFNREQVAFGRTAARVVCHSRYSCGGQAEPFAQPSDWQSETLLQPLDLKYLQWDGGCGFAEPAGRFAASGTPATSIASDPAETGTRLRPWLRSFEREASGPPF